MASRISNLGRVLFAAALALLLGSCASTRLDAQWIDPDHATARLSGRVMVVGMSGDETVRRLYEDAMAARLARAGIEPIRGYERLRGALRGDGALEVLQAAREAGATAVLSSAVVGRARTQHLITEPVPAWGGYYDRWFGHYWSLSYVRTEVRTVDVYFVNTSLTDTASGKIIWTARTRTEEPGAIEREVNVFADLIAGALQRQGLLGA